MGTLTKDQPGVSRTFSIFGRFACDFGITATSGHLCFSQNWQGKNWVLNFSWRFRRFSANKSSKQNAETEQARPQLYFAPKIIKIHLVILENELIEVCMLISKHCQKLSRVCHALLCVLLIKRTFTKASIHIHVWRRYIHVIFFDTFWNQHANFNQLILQNYQTVFDDFWCKMKLRTCLFCFCVFFTTFVYWKPAKPSREV